MQRGRQPPLKYVGGYIGIHATAKFPALDKISEELHELCMDAYGCNYNHSLPLGVILGSVVLSGGVPTEQRGWKDADDLICGDWSPGRYAWPLSTPSPLTVPIPAKGKQGWWRHEFA